MGVVTTKTYICDACGRQSADINFLENREGGHAVLSLKGQSMSINWEGMGAGSHYGEEWFLCHECAKKIRDFIKSLKKESQGN